MEIYLVKFKMRDPEGRTNQAISIPARSEIEAARRAIFDFLRRNYGPSAASIRDIEKKISSQEDLDKMKISVSVE